MKIASWLSSVWFVKSSMLLMILPSAFMLSFVLVTRLISAAQLTHRVCRSAAASRVLLITLEPTLSFWNSRHLRNDCTTFPPDPCLFTVKSLNAAQRFRARPVIKKSQGHWEEFGDGFKNSDTHREFQVSHQMKKGVVDFGVHLKLSRLMEKQSCWLWTAHIVTYKGVAVWTDTLTVYKKLG